MSLCLIVAVKCPEHKHFDKKYNEWYAGGMYTIVARYPKVRSPQAVVLGVLAAVYLVAMVFLQLFDFEDMPSILRYFWGAGSESAMLVLAALLVTTELLVLPALLGMKLSPLLRLVSVGAGVATALYWVVASLSVVLGAHSRNPGMFGDKFTEASGLLLPAATAVLVALIAAYWASAYGAMLPTAKPSKKHRK